MTERTRYKVLCPICKNHFIGEFWTQSKEPFHIGYWCENEKKYVKFNEKNIQGYLVVVNEEKRLDKSWIKSLDSLKI